MRLGKRNVSGDLSRVPYDKRAIFRVFHALFSLLCWFCAFLQFLILYKSIDCLQITDTLDLFQTERFRRVKCLSLHVEDLHSSRFFLFLHLELLIGTKIWLILLSTFLLKSIYVGSKRVFEGTEQIAAERDVRFVDSYGSANRNVRFEVTLQSVIFKA